MASSKFCSYLISGCNLKGFNFYSSSGFLIKLRSFWLKCWRIKVPSPQVPAPETGWSSSSLIGCNCYFFDACYPMGVFWFIDSDNIMLTFTESTGLRSIPFYGLSSPRSTRSAYSTTSPITLPIKSPRTRTFGAR